MLEIGRVCRGEIRNGKAKNNLFLCVLSELCGENLGLTIAHHVDLIMAPLVISKTCDQASNSGIGKINEKLDWRS